MTLDSSLLTNVASLFQDYRHGELEPMASDHVERWIDQFPRTVQEPLLDEIYQIFSKTYLSSQRVVEFLTAVAMNAKLTGGQPAEFWQRAVLLSIQRQGHSQQHMIATMRSVLAETVGAVDEQHQPGDLFVYLDDFLFSGQRLRTDLESWLPNAPQRGEVHIIYAGWHLYGQWRTNQELETLAKSAGKNLTFTWWSNRHLRFENRLRYRDSSDVLWPTRVPDDSLAQEYVSHIRTSGTDLSLRTPQQASQPLYSSEERRQLLEEQFVLAGLRIRAACREPSDVMRPLGYSPFRGFGFGALVANCWNCPNNAPLALWWGDPNAGATHPFSKWYPLLKRRTYGFDLW